MSGLLPLKRFLRKRFISSLESSRRWIYVASCQRVIGIFRICSPHGNYSIHRLQSRSLSKSISKITVWIPETVPNPMVFPELAGRTGVARSCVSDPDNVLSTPSKDVIEGHINASKTQMAVVVVNKICDDFIYDNGSKESAAKAFAMELHNRWGVGSSEKNDGVLILLSIQDRVVHFSTGSGVEHRLSNDAIQDIVEDMRKYLRSEDYGGALEFAVLQVDSIINDDEAYENARSSAAMKNLLTYGVIVWFVLYMGKVLLEDYKRTKQEAEKYQRLLRSENDLERIYDSDDVSCAHCLGLYDNCETSRDGQSTSLLKKVTLQCGHKFCSRCFDDLSTIGGQTGDTGTCTICAAPLAIRSEPLEPKAPPEKETKSWASFFSRTSPSSTSDAIEAALYRMQRYRHYYGDVVSAKELEAIQVEIKKGIAYGKESMRKRQEAIKTRRAKEAEEARVRRKEETERKMRDEEQRRKAQASGSSGSSSDWGGGSSSSSGGGGGSW